MQTQTTEFHVEYLEQKSGRKEDEFYNLHASMHSGRDCGIDSQDVTDQSHGPKSRLTKSTPAKSQNMQAMQRAIECRCEALHKVKKVAHADATQVEVCPQPASTNAARFTLALLQALPTPSAVWLPASCPNRPKSEAAILFPIACGACEQSVAASVLAKSRSDKKSNQ